MKIFGLFLIAWVALSSSLTHANEHRNICAKVALFWTPDGYINAAVGGTFFEGSGFLNQFVTVKFFDRLLGEQNVDPHGLGCFCLCAAPLRPHDYYYRADPVDASDLITAEHFFNFISEVDGETHPYYSDMLFEQPRVVKLVPQGGAPFYAVVAKIVDMRRSTNFSFYAGYEVTSPTMETSSYVPCAAKTQTDNLVNWPIPGLVQVQLDPANTLDSIAFIRLSRNTNSNRLFRDCTP